MINIWLKSYRKRFPYKRALESARQRCNNPHNNRYYCYGARGIKCYLTDVEIKELWFRDKAYKMKKPTIDRIDNNDNYTFKNCRFIENKLNTARAFQKPILQCDLSGNFIKKWNSGIEITRTLNFNNRHISECCLGKLKQSSGFIWRFANE